VNEAQKEMEEAVAFALKSREPSPEDALKDVYYST
jgi:TPP-dependent pyruvate/acetoin dehydrogenase alpha subunit